MGRQVAFAVSSVWIPPGGHWGWVCLLLVFSHSNIMPCVCSYLWALLLLLDPTEHVQHTALPRPLGHPNLPLWKPITK